MKRLLLVLAMVSIFVSSAAAVAPKHKRKSHRPVLQRLRHPFWHPVFPPTHESLIRQNQEIDRLGIPRIEDAEQLQDLIDAGELVPLPLGTYVSVDPRLPESRRYCRPWTAAFLLDLGKAFYAEFHKPIQVNSAVRTVEVQKKLRKRNRNAAPISGEAASSHMAGLTVDLERKRLSKPQVRFIQWKLLLLHARGLVEVEEEYYQFCFHIMVSGKYGTANDFVSTIPVEIPDED